MARKHERRAAREGALALLYSSDVAETDLEQVIETGSYPSDDVKLSEYAESLVLGVIEHREEIDQHLAFTSENWALDRMPIVDRAILRIAVYEMFFVDNVPVSVAIDEAVELAKAYGGEDESARFVNGVLGRIARAMEADQGAEGNDAAGHDASSAEGEPAGQVQPVSDQKAESDDAAE